MPAVQCTLVATNKKLNFGAVASVHKLLHLFLHLKPWRFSSPSFSSVLGRADEGGEGRMHSARAPQWQSQRGGGGEKHRAHLQLPFIIL